MKKINENDVLVALYETPGLFGIGEIFVVEGIEEMPSNLFPEAFPMKHFTCVLSWYDMENEPTTLSLPLSFVLEYFEIIGGL